MEPLAGKRYWLIGASDGIGAALAHELAQRGVHLVLSARNAEMLAAVHATLAGTDHHVVPLDVTQHASIMSAWQDVLAAWGKLDGVVYNAGTYEPMRAQALDLAQAERMVDVNFSGALRMLAFVLPHFRKMKMGHIALVGSVAGYRGLPSAIGYGASKAAIIHLAQNLRLDLARTGIRVQLINPGFVHTRLTAKNSFPMPCIITAQEAATAMANGLESSRFEIHFPKRFTYFLKALSFLPWRAYEALVSRTLRH